MKKLLKNALVSKDAPIVKAGCPGKSKKQGGVPTSLKDSGQHADEKEAKQETASKVESLFESISDSNSEAGKVKEGL